MTCRPPKPAVVIAPSTLVTPHQVYAAAALQGLLASPDTIKDKEKLTAAAMGYADLMCDRDVEAGRRVR
jgi:hypothetical protein